MRNSYRLKPIFCKKNRRIYRIFIPVLTGKLFKSHGFQPVAGVAVEQAVPKVSFTFFFVIEGKHWKATNKTMTIFLIDIMFTI
jgi:hypothetical protein